MSVAIHILLQDLIKINKPASLISDPVFAEGIKVLKKFEPMDPTRHLFSHTVNWFIINDGIYVPIVKIQNFSRAKPYYDPSSIGLDSCIQAML